MPFPIKNDSALLVHAAAVAAQKHRDQRRKDVDGSPYINHPLALADVLANEGGVTDANGTNYLNVTFPAGSCFYRLSGQ